MLGERFQDRFKNSASFETFLKEQGEASTSNSALQSKINSSGCAETDRADISNMKARYTLTNKLLMQHLKQYPAFSWAS